MLKADLTELLRLNSYPGRGIVAGLTPNGENAFAAYFIMGRSVNSRNRIFEVSNDGIITKAHDESKMTDPSLIIYSPVRKIGADTWIITNGDQTDTIYEHLSNGGSFEGALRTRTFEPDAPNFTPRISALIEIKGGKARLKMSELKSIDGVSCQRSFFEYDSIIPGEGYFIHTYMGDGSPIPSFEGEPEKVKIKGDFLAFAEEIWDSLNFDNKVSLYAAAIPLNNPKDARDVIFNKNI